MLRSLCAALLVAASAAFAAAAPPKLLVVVVVDQMRADYLDRFGPELTGGLARLTREGFVFAQARHPFVPTETAVGHATLLTGRAPSQHGILGNEWYDREAGRTVAAADDGAFGQGPQQLLSHTVGDALKSAFPQARVACVSQKDRAAILLCGKRPDAAVWYDRKTGRLATSRYYGALPEWAAAVESKRRIDERYAREGGTGAPTAAYYRELVYSSFSDSLIVEAAQRSVTALELGSDETPDLLALSLSANDYIGHRHGPDGPEIHDSILAVDAALGGLLEFLDRRVGRYALILTGDHGVARRVDHPQARAAGARALRLDLLPDALDAELRMRLDMRKDSGRLVLDVLGPHVYLDRRAAARWGVDHRRLASEAVEALVARPEVAAAYAADDVIDGRLDGKPFADVLYRSFHRSRGGEVVFLLKENAQWDFGDSHAVNHGQPYDHDARVPLVFFGAGIKAGRSEEPVTSLDIAPTAAKLLETPFETGAESRPLELPR
ncbi:MAG: alkaline phosphatase family protein [Elusimicrobia bacterium]|nr:alkaline phosphatase family protein [Elusimicrobiota bacterium]